MIATLTISPMVEGTATYCVDDESSTSGTADSRPIIIRRYGSMNTSTFFYQCYDFEKLAKEIDQFINKLRLDRPRFRLENRYPRVKAPFIRMERRNRLIGKREKRIGLKR